MAAPAHVRADIAGWPQSLAPNSNTSPPTTDRVPMSRNGGRLVTATATAR